MIIIDKGIGFRVNEEDEEMRLDTTQNGETGYNFTFNFKVENIKILPGSYHVTCSQKNISKFIQKSFEHIL